jgi:hypothetical protein
MFVFSVRQDRGDPKLLYPLTGEIYTPRTKHCFKEIIENIQ